MPVIVKLPHLKKARGRWYHRHAPPGRAFVGTDELRKRDPNSFRAAYDAVCASIATRLKPPRPRSPQFKQLVAAYRASGAFASLRASTQREYDRVLTALAAGFLGDYDLAAFEDARVRADVREWRDAHFRGPRARDHALAIARRVISWGYDEGWIAHNHLTRMGREHRPDRRDSVWTRNQWAAALAAASEEEQFVLITLFRTGQRISDVLNAPRTAVVDGRFRLRQSKKRRLVDMPLHPELEAVLDPILAAPVGAATTLLTKNDGTPWTYDTFEKRWRRIRAAAGVTDLTLHDVRRTVRTELARAGTTPEERRAILGHQDDADAMSEIYEARLPEFADRAIEKWIAWENGQGTTVTTKVTTPTVARRSTSSN